MKRKKTSTGGMIITQDYNEVPSLWILNKAWNPRFDDANRLAAGPSAEYVDFVTGVLGSGQVILQHLAYFDHSRI